MEIIIEWRFFGGVGCSNVDVEVQVYSRRSNIRRTNIGGNYFSPSKNVAESILRKVPLTLNGGHPTDIYSWSSNCIE